MQKMTKFLATACYAGYLPFAPGTWGTLVGVLFYFFIRRLPHEAYAVTLAVFIALAVWVSGWAQEIFGSADPREVVIDEAAGFLVTMAFHRADVLTIAAGFVLFRIFDIVKPWPIRWIERRFTNGRGIVGDDVMAGVYANAVLWIVRLILPNL